MATRNVRTSEAGYLKGVFVNMLMHLYARLSPRAAHFGREQNTVRASRYYTVRMLSKRNLTWLRQPDFQTDDTVHNAAQGGPTRAASRWPQFAVVQTPDKHQKQHIACMGCWQSPKGPHYAMTEMKMKMQVRLYVNATSCSHIASFLTFSGAAFVGWLNARAQVRAGS